MYPTELSLANQLRQEQGCPYETANTERINLGTRFEFQPLVPHGRLKLRGIRRSQP